jgi:small-conductance mechanosensitive channel
VSGILDFQLFRIAESPVTVGSLITALAIFAASYLLARLARRVVVDRLLSGTRLTAGIRYAMGRFLGYVIVFFGAVVALETLGVRAGALAAFGAALGVGIGFGLQDIARNFISGLILLIERPIQVGDRIEVGSVSGDVVEIRSRATVVRTNDDIHLIVPNSRFISDTVINHSYGRPRVRHKIPIRVASGSNPRDVETALVEAARRSPNVLADPVPAVRLRGFGDSSLDFELLCWTSTKLSNPGAFRSEINLLAHEALTKSGIQLPSPQHDVHIRSAVPLDPLLDRGTPPGPGTEDADS